MNVLTLFKKSSFAPAFFLLSAERRRALAAVYAFARAVDDAVDDPGSLPPEDALAQWRALLKAPYVTPTEAAAAPPAWAALEESLDRFPIDRRHLLDLIDGVARDLDPSPIVTTADFEAYCYGVASTVGLACLPIFGLMEDFHREFAVQLGLAVQTVNIVRDVRPDALQGRVYLPREDLKRFGVDPADLGGERLSPALDRLLRFEATRARAHFARARRALPESSRRLARPAVLMGAIYERILGKLERGGFHWGKPRPSLGVGEKLGCLVACLTH